MTPCEFYHPENYCTFEEDCKFRDKQHRCNAKESDLIEICGDCGKPVSECGCGTNWTLVKDEEGNLGVLTNKEFSKLKVLEAKQKQ